MGTLLPFPSSPLFLPSSSSYLPSLLSPPLPLELGHLNTARGVCGSAVHSSNGVWGIAPVEFEFGAFYSLKIGIWWYQFHEFL